jgi:hypothetical protein
MWIILLVVPFPLPVLGTQGSKGERMRKDELMKADLFSEILLLGSGVAIVVALGMVVVAAISSAAAVLQ